MEGSSKDLGGLLRLRDIGPGAQSAQPVFDGVGCVLGGASGLPYACRAYGS